MTSPSKHAVLCWGKHHVKVLGYHTSTEGKQTADVRYWFEDRKEWYNTRTDRYETPRFETPERVYVTLRGIPTEDLDIRVW